MLLAAAASHAQPAVKQVLVLQSLDRGNLTLDAFTGNFRVQLDQGAGKPVNVVQVVVGPTGFIGAADDAVVEYIRSIYAARPAPDLVMSAGGPAAVFARKYSHQLFPNTPLLLASVDQRYLRGAPLGDNEAAVSVVNDFSHLVEDILQILPETQQVFMIIGSGTLGQFWRRELQPEFDRYAGRLAFIWSDELTLQAILKRVATLPANTAIFYLTFGTDVQGGAYADEQVLRDLHGAANAPMFATLSPLLGHGIVGGSMMSIEVLAKNTAQVANRILDGAPARDFRPSPQVRGQPVFDWRELQRWGIPESRLPKDSIVLFRGPTLWSEYRLAILASLALLFFQSLLIARLLYERQARQRAESDSLRNLALAADANRRETMSALTTSMGHELAQPLGTVVLNAAALQKAVAANGITPEETLEILTDIQAGADLAILIFDRHRHMLRGRQLEKKPIEIRRVVDESLALVARDMRERQIKVTLALATAPCIIDGDPVLLEQVFLNLVRNAMDALSQTPPADRQITIGSAILPAELRIWVSDSGPGLPKQIIDSLYKPFVTTKPQGLGIGLTIAHSIVTAHGGTIVADDNGGGATFTVTLPHRTAEIPATVSWPAA